MQLVMFNVEFWAEVNEKKKKKKIFRNTSISQTTREYHQDQNRIHFSLPLTPLPI